MDVAMIRDIALIVLLILLGVSFLGYRLPDWINKIRGSELKESVAMAHTRIGEAGLRVAQLEQKIDAIAKVCDLAFFKDDRGISVAINQVMLSSKGGQK